MKKLKRRCPKCKAALEINVRPGLISMTVRCQGCDCSIGVSGPDCRAMVVVFDPKGSLDVN